MALERQALDRARRARDPRFDGRFFIAVTSTGIYCRPICPAPSPKDEHIRYFSTSAQARSAGFRPCLRCRPEASPGTPAWLGTLASVSRALRLIADGALNEGSVEQLADRLGLTARHLRRLFMQHLGATPLHIARGRFECRLPYRPPYDWDAAMAFLQPRATAGVEHITRTSYRRTIVVSGVTGWIEVSHLKLKSMLTLSVHCGDPRPLRSIVERTRRIFDTGANPAAIATDLSSERVLIPALNAHAGLRVVGAWDGFEIAVRAVLGQQISVRAATTLAGRIASQFGTSFEGSEHLNRLFPSPTQLANAPLERCGVMPARAQTIRELARRTADGAIVFDDNGQAQSAIAALRRVRGIGDWTAQYVAMRAFGEPDAFLRDDLILRRVAGNVTARDLERDADAWRPWRAYAVMLLWQGANDDHDIEKCARGGVADDVDRSVVGCGAR